MADLLKEKPYFNIKKKKSKDDYTWTFQCPHEPNRAVMVVEIEEEGQMVLCLECARAIAKTLVEEAEWLP